MMPGIHPGFIAAILAVSSSFGVGMDPTSRRKTQFPRCGSDLKSTQKRPSNRAKKYSWLREIDVLDYLATPNGPDVTYFIYWTELKRVDKYFYALSFLHIISFVTKLFAYRGIIQNVIQ